MTLKPPIAQTLASRARLTGPPTRRY